MADRVISEQAALEAICHDKCGLSPNRCISGISGECVQIKPIKAVPSADKWIPVSERLPEKTGMYLTSFGDLVTSKSFDGHYFRTESSEVRFVPDAWMPLPKPYEPQGSGKGANE